MGQLLLEGNGRDDQHGQSLGGGQGSQQQHINRPAGRGGDRIEGPAGGALGRPVGGIGTGCGDPVA